jgi:hypothetical protein
MLTILMMLVGGLIFAVVMYYLVGAAASSLKVGLMALTVCFLLTILFVGDSSLPLGLNIYPEDVVCSTLLSAGLARYLHTFQFLQFRRVLGWAALAICLLSFARGAATIGLKEAGVTFRSTYYLYTVIVYVSSFSLTAEHWEEVRSVLRWLTAGIMVIAIARWGLVAIGSESVNTWYEAGASETGGLRVVPATAALVIGEAFLVETFMNDNKIEENTNRWFRFAGPLLFLSLILLQHRTIWIALLPAMVWLGFMDRRFLRYAIGIVILGTAFLLLIFTTDLAPNTRSALLLSGSSAGTFLWRLSSWQGMLDLWSEAPLFSQIAGIPFGADQSRILDNGVVTSRGSHDFFISTLFNLGLLGLATVVTILVTATWRMVRNAKYSGASGKIAAAIAAILLMQWIYNITYGIDYMQGTFIGVALTLLVDNCQTVELHNKHLVLQTISQVDPDFL